MPPRPSLPLRGIAFALSGFTVWVLTDTCVKLSGEAALPPYEIVLFLGLVGMVVLAGLGFARGEAGKLRPRDVRGQLVRASLALINNLCNAIALKHLPLASFYLIAFMAPLLVTILAALFLREKLDWKRLAAVIAGFGGVVLALDPGAGGKGDWIGYAVMATGTFIFALNFIWTRRMTAVETPESLAFTTAFVAAAGCAVPSALHFVPLAGFALFIVLAAGTLNVLGNLFFYKAVEHAPAAIVAPFHYTQIIAGAVLGYLIWHDVPSLNLLAGAAVIAACGIYITSQARRAEAVKDFV